LSSPAKRCALDPIPPFLLREFIDELLSFLGQLPDASLTEISCRRVGEVALSGYKSRSLGYAMMVSAATG